MTQAFVNQGNNTLALRLLAKGFTPARVLDELAANDPGLRISPDRRHRPARTRRGL